MKEFSNLGGGIVSFGSLEYSCDMFFNTKTSETLLKVCIKDEVVDQNVFQKVIKKINVQLNTGRKILVLENILIKTEYKMIYGNDAGAIYTYRSQYLLDGINVENDKQLLFNSLIFTIPNILQWGNIQGYYSESWMKLELNNDLVQEIFKNDTFSIRYEVHRSYLPYGFFEMMSERIELVQKGNIIIDFVYGASIEEAIEVFNKVKILLELCMLKEILPSKILGFSNDIKLNQTNIDCEAPIEIKSSGMMSNDNVKDFEREIQYIKLDNLIKYNMPSIFFEKYEKLKDIIEIYLELIYSNSLSNRRMFLYLVQALEKYHSKFKARDKNEYNERIDKVILINRPEKFRDNDKEYLTKNMARAITLRCRIADLLIAEYKTYFNTNEFDHLLFPDMVAETRNHYMHDKINAIPDLLIKEEDLWSCNLILVGIFEYHIFGELGVYSNQELDEMLKYRYK